MHDLAIDAPLLGRICRAFGAVRATPENARMALAAGHDVVVFPGGDIDSGRPMTRPRQVDFGSRRGYVRLALESGRPIVPLATIGSHYTYLLLPLDALWRAIGLRRVTRMERLPVPVAFVAALCALGAVLSGALGPAWLLVALAALFVPNPVRVTTEALRPIDVAALTAHLADPRERVEEAHRLVHGALARAVATMQHTRAWTRNGSWPQGLRDAPSAPGQLLRRREAGADPDAWSARLMRGAKAMARPTRTS
jgi:1-acyl-sn-glycerol-3-phosphate acyltransferase